MNRCIACYRCVRFYRDYAGGTDLDAFAGHDAVYFGRYEEGALESEFSGNLVEVCPTGVFTDKLFRKRFTRVWDLQTAPSVCMHCGLGCNIIPGERYGTLRRIRNRYNYDVNGYFLCDRGRFGYDYINGPARLRRAVSRMAAAGPTHEFGSGEAIGKCRAGAESRARRYRHRLAASLARSKFRAQAPCRRRPILLRCFATRKRSARRRAGPHAVDLASSGVASRGRADRCGAHPGRRSPEHRAPCWPLQSDRQGFAATGKGPRRSAFPPGTTAPSAGRFRTNKPRSLLSRPNRRNLTPRPPLPFGQRRPISRAWAT